MGLLQDLRYALRTLRRSPGFTLVALATLALGVGATCAVFTVLSAVLLRPLPFADPGRLVMVWETMPGNGARGAAPANFLDWRRESRSFAALAGYFEDTRTVGGDRPERVDVASVSGNLFSLLGARAAVGRTLLPADDGVDAERAVVVSHAYWRSHLGGGPAALGRTLVLDGVPHTVVGVMGEGFDFPERTQLWLPSRGGVPDLAGFPGDLGSARDLHYFNVVGRLAPGVSIDAARAEMRTLASSLAARYPDLQKGLGINPVPLRDALTGRVEPVLLTLFAAVAAVLLIGCVNLANLLLARGAGRAREMAVRAALGAGRGRLVAQMLAESVVLAVAGGACGLALAWSAVGLLPEAIELPLRGTVAVDGRVVAFALGVSMLSGLLFGALPTLRAARAAPAPGLEGARGDGGSRAARRPGRARVVAEVAVALVVVTCAGLLVNSLVRLLRVDPGFRAEGVLTFRVDLPGEAYPQPARAAFFQRLVGGARALPGVAAAGAVTNLPAGGGQMNRGFRIEGRPAPARADEMTLDYQVVEPGYFGALRIPRADGRALGDGDAAGAPRVAVVNRALARRWFPGESPLGRRIALGDPDRRDSWYTVVGVVGDVRHGGPERGAQPEAYVTLRQDPARAMSVTLAAAPGTDPRALAAPVRALVRALDPTLPVTDVRTLDEALAGTLARRRFVTALLAAFAAMALLLAAVGVYGVMAAAVAGRTREIGVRIALGARAGEVLGMVARQGMSLVAAGVGLGLAGALAATRAVAGMVYGVGTADPATFALAVLVLSAAGLLACWLPARRAARVNPMTVLRQE
jgi:putative ABC transport system permease protein